MSFPEFFSPYVLEFSPQTEPNLDQFGETLFLWPYIEHHTGKIAPNGKWFFQGGPLYHFT